VKLTFRGHKTAKAVGTIAHGGPQHLGKVSGILVQKDFQFTFAHFAFLLYYFDFYLAYPSPSSASLRRKT